MRRLVVVCLGLLLGLLAGLTLRPDDGTPVSISPTETGAVVSGANHGKPLPRVPDVRALLGDLAALSGVAAIALVLVPSWVTTVRDGAPRPSHWSDPRARPLTRRGPPASG